MKILMRLSPEPPDLHGDLADRDGLVHRPPGFLGELLDVEDAHTVRTGDGHLDGAIRAAGL